MRDPIIPLDTSKVSFSLSLSFPSPSHPSPISLSHSQQKIVKHGKIREPVRMQGKKIDFELPLPHVDHLPPPPGQELVGRGRGRGEIEEEGY